MEPIRLLAVILTIVVFPGILYLAIAAGLLVVTRPSRLWPGGLRLGSEAVVPLAAAVGAATLLPLPGSPLLGISGAVSDSVALLVLLAVAVDRGLTRRPCVMAAAAAAALLMAAAAMAATLDLTAIIARSDPAVQATRAAAGLLGLVAVVRCPAPRTPVEASTQAVLLLAAAAVALPRLPGLGNPAVAALVGLAVVVLAGLISSRGAGRRQQI